MARPPATILLTETDDTGTEWHILAADNYYAITYQDQPINIRSINHMNLNSPPKYKKTGYTNLGNCLVAVRKLNELFQTTDFGYIKIGDRDEDALG